MQSACMGCLMELAEKDKRILYLTADSGDGGLDKIFRKNFPDRSFDFGIAEGNTVAAAAGLATAGKIPFVYTAGPFLTYRSFEFIRNDICMQNLNVKLIGTGSGLSVSSLGPTHHTTEDIAVLRVLPNLKIMSPATPNQVFACMKEAYVHKGPVYIRLGMNKEKEYFDSDHSFDIHRNELLRKGSDITIFTTGSILDEVMNAAEILNGKGISANVINVPMIKPFDQENVIEMAAVSQLFVSVEEHNVLGGLGSIIAEILTEQGIAMKLLRIGLQDAFSVGYGKLEDVRDENGLSAEKIALKIWEKTA